MGHLSWKRLRHPWGARRDVKHMLTHGKNMWYWEEAIRQDCMCGLVSNPLGKKMSWLFIISSKFEMEKSRDFWAPGYIWKPPTLAVLQEAAWLQHLQHPRQCCILHQDPSLTPSFDVELCCHGLGGLSVMVLQLFYGLYITTYYNYLLQPFYRQWWFNSVSSA